MSTIAERVAAGAAFLDEREPGWWRVDREKPIHTSQLDIDNHCRCVLGQLHDSYQEGRNALGLTRANRGVALGFYPGKADVPTSDLLNAEWERVITERRQSS